MRRLRRLPTITCALLSLLTSALVNMAPTPAQAAAIDEVHYTYTGPTSVAFDWRGSCEPNPVRAHGKLRKLGGRINPEPDAHLVERTVLGGETDRPELPEPPTTTRIGGGLDQTFNTAPTGGFRFDVEADIGSSLDYPNVATNQNQIACDAPAFVLGVGDLTYGEPFGQASVDQHFDDVMAWSQTAAYMPAWGNHEWENPPRTTFATTRADSCCPTLRPRRRPRRPGAAVQDWGWFDAGGVRFISYPEPYTPTTWTDWQSKADAIMAAGTGRPEIHYIVTFGHRPAYSTGFHPGRRQPGRHPRTASATCTPSTSSTSTATRTTTSGSSRSTASPTSPSAAAAAPWSRRGPAPTPNGVPGLPPGTPPRRRGS